MRNRMQHPKIKMVKKLHAVYGSGRPIAVGIPRVRTELPVSADMAQTLVHFRVDKDLPVASNSYSHFTPQIYLNVSMYLQGTDRGAISCWSG
jgi:hypothetical protein